jgi:tetratricopeptide (TPR) repeat protein
MSRIRASVARASLAIALATVIAESAARRAEASESSAELVHQARAHERAREDDLAARRYNEAIQLDQSDGEAYLGLGMLRLRMGDLREAERVFTVALVRIPTLRAAMGGRARARWAMGMRETAEREMQEYATASEGDVAALRELAAWYGEDGFAPAQLATWRMVQSIALQHGDGALAREARTMVRALQIVVGPADPVTSPAAMDPTRKLIASVAKRGG